MVGKFEGKRLFGRTRRRRRIILDWNLKEYIWECVDWIRLIQDRDQWWAVVKTVKNWRVP